MANDDGHAWMTPGMPLAKQHLLSDYYRASGQNDGPDEDCIEGIVYVETDVKYEKPSGDISIWAKGPLDEIKFLRAIVEGEYGVRDSAKLLGIVAWAPMDQLPSVLEQWLDLAERTAGPQTWKRLKGFRFLLQFISDQNDFEGLVFGSNFQQNLKILGRRGLSFDIGVDQNSGGTWQLEAISKAMELAHDNVPKEDQVTFILNHFCKPDFASDDEPFYRWRAAIETMSTLSKTYMKLSGAFSELPAALQGIANIASHMKPWCQHVFQVFGPHRIMVGSDWPVCNLKGPRGDSSRVAWKEVVDQILEDLKEDLSADDRDCVWSKTAVEAYRLDVV
jgi:L-rhamnono-1,4-lactonase